jgi:hypothetical protein
VILIAGMGGQTLYDINNTDPDYGYFARLMAANANPTYGAVRFTISSTQLTSEFLRASGGDFRDTFSITKPPSNAAIVSDTFSRTVTGGWGSADIGGAYSGTSTADFFVNGTEGSMKLPTAGVQRKATLSGIDVRDVDMKIRVKVDKLAAGTGHQISLLMRQIANIGQYRARLELTPSGSAKLVGQKYLNSTNVTTNIGSSITASSLTYSANQYLWLRVQVVGTNPTTIRIRVWLDGQPEPSTWQYSGSDSEAALQTSGSVAILSRLPSTSTVAPVVITYDDFTVTAP